MKGKRHISYEQLLEIISWGIFSMKMKGNSVSDKRLKKYKFIKKAIYNGIYVGSPGRDIYFMLPYLNKNQMKEIAILMRKKFPVISPKNHGNVSACIRFIYGQFNKQGILRSDKDFKRMKKEKLDWELSRKFLKLLYKELEKNNNYYGLTILCEMEGHRLGDEAVTNKDEEKLREMGETYNKSVLFAYKCKSYKHLFSVYYWAGGYFVRFGNIDKAIIYFKLAILNAEKYYYKYFPDGDQYYSKRLLQSFNYIKKNNKEDWKNFYKKCKKNIKGFL